MDTEPYYHGAESEVIMEELPVKQVTMDEETTPATEPVAEPENE